MPPISPATVDRILEYTSVAANTLHNVATASQIPFLGRVCTLTLTIIPMVQSTRFQRERCLRIVEEIHHSLCALTSLSIHSDDIQAPKMLDQIAKYASALQKLDSCLRSQQELGTIKRLFKQGEITAQFDTCETELRASLASFTVELGAGLATALVEFNIDTETRHQNLLEMISSQSTSIDTVSSIGRSSLNASSGSFSLLPATPKIFHGRESELEDLVNLLTQPTSRIAILGPGGMGKTTLAMAALHDPKVAGKYPTCYFISCDSAYTSNSLNSMIASSLGLESSGALSGVIIRHLSAGPPCLLILDNFETPWEPLEGRAKVEEFISLLADVQHVALLITMRGAERPEKVAWTRPFLRPLLPLTPIAAHQTFIDIADDVHDNLTVGQLLEITDNVPLAIQLIASIAASEGGEATLERWNLERITLLSAGYDKRSNLEISITLSLSSPRMLSSPHALRLLSLMSLLSDGISDLDLVHSNIPIQDIPKCKTTLLRTSLAYIDHAGRFKVLAPIREYIHLARPPSQDLLRPLRNYFIDLLRLYVTWRDEWHTSSIVVDLIPRLVSNFGNLQALLQQGLDSDHADLRESILGIIMLNTLNLTVNRALTPLMLGLPEILSEMNDHELHGRFITSAFEARGFYTLPDPEMAIDKAMEHFRAIQDHDAEARLLNAVAAYYRESVRDLRKAEDYYRLALTVASQSNSYTAKVGSLAGLAIIEWHRGNYSRGLQLAQQIYRVACASGNVRGELNGIRLQAVCCFSLGDFKHAMKWVDTGKEVVVRAGLQGGQMEYQLMDIKASVYERKTEYSSARGIQEAILHRTSAVLSHLNHAYTLINIASLDVSTGASADLVSRNLNAGATSFRNAQYLRGISFCELYDADLRHREGDLTGARDEYIRLFAAAWDTEDEIVCLCLAKLADPTNPVHTETESARWAVIFLAFALCPTVRSLLTVHQALRRLGDVLVRQGEEDTALNVLTVALDGFTRMDIHQSRAECMRTMGDVYVRRGDVCMAREMWEAARPLFERSEQKKSLVGINERLQMLGVAQKS
ncbi:NB-ARC domain-containing protein [Mycena venus]|uniref:NB-ARC domain-containing protein n=1 Tax=Mycena venus TaxID=2733690 RepID=A0A8H7CNX4_9AGAR|nr:NB-ARC domain-containing protein [Mycena venus]